MRNKSLFFILVNSFIYTLLFNSLLIAQRFESYQTSDKDGYFFLIINIIFSFSFAFPVIYLLSNSLSLTILFYFISALSSYFIYFYNIEIDQNIIASFFETNYSEASSFISLKLIFFLLIAIGIAYLTHKFLNPSFSSSTRQNTKKVKFICFIFIISALLGDSEAITNFMPYNVIRYSGTYFIEKAFHTKKRINIAQQHNFSLDSKSKDLITILIIGESARSDHFSLNNYQRETNPLLKNVKNLIFFPSTTACYPLTRVAVPCMLTRATKDDRSTANKETSFISIFKKLGVNSSWIGTQGSRSVIDSPYIALAKESDKLLLPGAEADFTNGYDDTLLPYVDKFIKNNNSSSLLILHTLGSHFHYEDRYPKNFQKFTPVCFKKEFFSDMKHCSKEEIINSYDNSILFTDYLIYQIIDKVKDKNAIVIYTSDHGESLGENGRYLHGINGVKEQMMSEMIFWASDKYIENYPQNYQNLISKKQKNISHDNLFHTILGCSGIKSNIINKSLNLCH